MRGHPKYKHDYAAMRLAGKPKKVILIAIARKLAVTANAIMRDGAPYNGQGRAE